MRALRSASCAGRSDDYVEFVLDDGWTCRVHVLAGDLVRVLFSRAGELKEPRTWMAAGPPGDVAWGGRDRRDTSIFPRPSFGLSESPDVVGITIGNLALDVTLAPFGIAWSYDGRRFASDRPTYSYQWSEKRGVIRHYMSRAAGDRYYGLGDKTGRLDLHGRRLRTLAVDALGYDGETSDPLYKHWPFLLARDSASEIFYGVFYDTLAPMTFDLGCEYDNYHGFYRYAEIDDGDLDYYVLAGPRVRDVVRGFSELTGRMALGPRWSLGYANTAMSLADAPDAHQRLADFAQKVVDNAVPLSAFHFGSGYTSRGKRRYVFTWNLDKFPDPRAAVESFRAIGARVVVNLKPCLLDDHPAYAEVAAKGAFVGDARSGAPCIGQFWDGEGAHVDFTHPAGIEWWQESLRREVLGYGIDAAWNDNNEYEIWDDDGAAHGFGTALPIARSRPLQALLMTRASAEAQAAHRPAERVYTVTRAGPPGIQRYAQTWSGDNTTSWRMLRWNIRMGLTMSLSGMFNTGHDVGGFAGPVPDAELLIRWTQNGAFSPRFIMNSWKEDGSVNSPWLHAEALAPIRAAIRLRYRLLPYFYTLYRRAATMGEPMLRPLFYDFADDPRAFEDSDDFMLGASLLVATVVIPGQRERSVYLPLGPSTWVDFHSGMHHAAGAVATVPAPLERAPMLVPAGAMIPMTDSENYAMLHDEPSRQLRVFPAAAAGVSSFTLYEDDGLTLGYREGQFAEVAFELTSNATDVNLCARVEGRWKLPYQTIRVVFPPDERRRVTLSGDGVELVAAN
jgi:alpha-glucosidase